MNGAGLYCNGLSIVRKLINYGVARSISGRRPLPLAALHVGLLVALIDQYREAALIIVSFY